jgi:hypothetical protein
MTADPSLEPILEYLRENWGRYSLDALRQQLLQSGYDPAAVDQAIAAFQEQNAPARRSRVWPKALLVLGVNAVLTVGIIGFPKLLKAGASWTNDLINAYTGLIVLIAAVELIGGIALSFPAKTRSWGLALVFGFLLVIPIVILGLGGLCIYLLSGAH